MSKYRKFSVAFIIIEVAILIIINLFGSRISNNDKDRLYQVDISRVVYRMDNGEALSDIDLSEYKSIISVSIFDEASIYKNEYAVRKINGEYYCFEYKEVKSNSTIIALNVLVVCIIIMNIIMLLYMDKKLISPFVNMDNLTQELAKGNLSTPIKQEKSKYFSRFIWGMDMLRETLEDNKKRELELLKEKKTLILSLSHDVKTPLSAIGLYTKALRRNIYESEAERVKAFDGIDKNVEEISRYVEEITQASRDDFLSLEVNTKEVYLAPIIEEIKNYYEEKMTRLHIEFSIDTVTNCLLYADFNRLIEVLQNCIENAIKYGDGRKIGISFDEEENCKLITVTNTGCEISKEELLHIFDSFYRGSNSEKAEGSGLGLYICKELMHRMDGEIFARLGDNEFIITIVVRKL